MLGSPIFGPAGAELITSLIPVGYGNDRDRVKASHVPTTPVGGLMPSLFLSVYIIHKNKYLKMKLLV